MDKKELEFRKEIVKEITEQIEFYETEKIVIEFDLMEKRTFKNDRRYVNLMSVLTNLNNIIGNLKNQRYSIQREIDRTEENMKAEEEINETQEMNEVKE